MKEIIENLEERETFNLGIKLLCRIFNLECSRYLTGEVALEVFLNVNENLEETKKLSYSEQASLLNNIQHELALNRKNKRPNFTMHRLTIKLRPCLLIRHFE